MYAVVFTSRVVIQCSRQYAGFCNSGQALARFDTIANRYLIVGDEGRIKVLQQAIFSDSEVVSFSAVIRAPMPRRSLSSCVKYHRRSRRFVSDVLQTSAIVGRGSS